MDYCDVALMHGIDIDIDIDYHDVVLVKDIDIAYPERIGTLECHRHYQVLAHVYVDTWNSADQCYCHNSLRYRHFSKVSERSSLVSYFAQIVSIKTEEEGDQSWHGAYILVEESRVLKPRYMSHTRRESQLSM